MGKFEVVWRRNGAGIQRVTLLVEAKDAQEAINGTADFLRVDQEKDVPTLWECCMVNKVQ